MLNIIYDPFMLSVIMLNVIMLDCRGAQPLATLAYWVKGKVKQENYS
jgi:hypothetical protein